ncbi:MAG TPA: Asp-tRNA(Asn)/Glu-tRNA(Gln) amidotransferase subunit GatC [Polyangiales bacterium]|nr:Asp-tRNA(Asn)/Glu-tRNA(Gln) amidotransferase subunit GatC [Polyangiales bacterium]
MSSSRISIETVKHVAKLAALSLNEAEEAQMQAELNSILAHMDELSEVDVSGVAPTFHSVVAAGELRSDVVLPSLSREELLQMAPAQEAGGFAVPKVLDGD